jgi:hypothetical protein
MGNASKTFALILTLTIAISSLSLIIIKPSYAQDATPTPSPTPLPTPSVPEFTVQLVGPSVDVPTTYSLNQSSGQIVAQIGYTNEYSALNITMKNQPFTPYLSDYYGNIIQLMYNVRIKPHNGDNWVEVYSPYNAYPIQSNSDYTTISISIEGQMDSPLGAIAGTKSDIQVEALIGYIHVVVIGFSTPWVFNGTESSWSNTQTLSIPANIPLSPTPAPSSSSSTPTLSPTKSAASSLALIIAVSLVVIAFLLAVIVALLFYIRKQNHLANAAKKDEVNG